MFDFIKNVAGTAVTIITFGFALRGRGLPWYKRMAWCGLGFALSFIAFGGFQGMLFNLMVTAVIMTISFGVSILKRGFDGACERFANLFKWSSSFN